MAEENIWQIGQLVRSKAGRDKNKYFLVLDYNQTEKMLYLVDGKKRTLANPKKKNVRHIQKTNKVALNFANKILSNKTMTVEEIAKNIDDLLQK